MLPAALFDEVAGVVPLAMPISAPDVLLFRVRRVLPRSPNLVVCISPGLPVLHTVESCSQILLWSLEAALCSAAQLSALFCQELAGFISPSSVLAVADTGFMLPERRGKPSLLNCFPGKEARGVKPSAAASIGVPCASESLWLSIFLGPTARVHDDTSPSRVSSTPKHLFGSTVSLAAGGGVWLSSPGGTTTASTQLSLPLLLPPSPPVDVCWTFLCTSAVLAQVLLRCPGLLVAGRCAPNVGSNTLVCQ
mmetsp:Transcript_57122/g.113557  ORF Transcript_57122/g.113557 Transcript_57122/m.113557 type:complete len:250 (-) Transcript_57122:979-1728(-)